jgi:plasmid stabilization system protein ParE
LKVEVIWLHEVLEDLKRLHAFIEPHSPAAASRVVDALIDSAETLAVFTEKGRPWNLEPNFRELTVKYGARGYVIRYRLHQDDVYVVRVWHALEDR